MLIDKEEKKFPVGCEGGDGSDFTKKVDECLLFGVESVDGLGFYREDFQKGAFAMAGEDFWVDVVFFADGRAVA